MKILSLTLFVLFSASVLPLSAAAPNHAATHKVKKHKRVKHA